MPWEIRRGTSQCSGYGVFKEGTSELEGCHSTKEAARRQMAALYASEPEAAQKDVITNQTTPNKYPDYIGPKKKKKIVSKMMEPGTFVEGDFAMGSVDDDVYVGQIVHIMTDGMLGIEGSKMTIMASPENPAILIRIFEQHEDGYWKETHLFTGFDSMTGSKIDPLPMKAEYFSMGGTEITGNENTRGTQQEFVNDMMERIGKADNVRVGQMVSWNSSGGRATGKVTRIIRNGRYNVPDSDFTITGTPDDPAVAIRVYRDGEPTDRIVGHKMSTLRRVGKSMNKDIEEAMEILKSLEKGYKDKEKSMDEDEDDWYKRDYSAEQRRQMASRGQAMPDGSFPIANRTDLGNAIQSVGRASNYDAARRHIIGRARALNAIDMLPEDWNVNKSVDSDSANQSEVPADLSAIFANMPRHAKRVNTTGNAPVNFTFLQGDK